jgi:hypothetical protein
MPMGKGVHPAFAEAKPAKKATSDRKPVAAKGPDVGIREKTGAQKNYAQVDVATGKNQGPSDDSPRRIQAAKESRDIRSGVAGNKEKSKMFED